MVSCRSYGAGAILYCDAINRSLRWSLKAIPGYGVVGVPEFWLALDVRSSVKGASDGAESGIPAQNTETSF
jgi:hypothetical protein